MKFLKLTTPKSLKLYQTFSQVLKKDFPNYSPQLKDYFLTKEVGPEKIKKILKDKSYEILIAEEEGEVVGFLFMEKPYGGVSYCAWVGVVEEMKKRGVGRKLMEFWEEEAIKKGCHKLMLLTQTASNRNIFPRYGFREEGFEEKSWFGLNAWIFGKVIGGPDPEKFLR